ncbi:hypothetical protein [Gynuella sunshinyii]|uniref:Uncharacterized protein n=1 Tax=Gynuella sunshinyii YC6258 TaxID=1445510 RepID=A0A0C5VKM2_9GAMM|nr:hypothetical protein [Gynuella sunshinyii]AJQ94831.1 hypothetical Protein YC6258_02793 [Gynuella sunshinyii YC6258]
MSTYELRLPNDFSDYEWEVKSKGWFNGAVVTFEGELYKLSFYDPTRLSQEIKDELLSESVFFENNLLVVKTVDRSHIENAVNSLVISGKISYLKAE